MSKDKKVNFNNILDPPQAVQNAIRAKMPLVIMIKLFPFISIL